MSSVPQVFAGVTPDLFPMNPVLDVHLNRPQASQYGVTATNFSQLLSTAYAQNFSYLIKSDYLQYWVVVEAKPKYRANVGDLDWLYFNSLTNQSTLYNTGSSFDVSNNLVPFRAIGTATPKIGPVAVNHFNGFTSVTLAFDLQPGIPLGVATNVIEQMATSMTPQYIAPDITRTFQGEAQLFDQAQTSLLLGMLVAFFVMYIILGILYESYVHPITVLLSIPLAFAGGLGTLWLFGKELSLYSGIGMFMLAGIVKKNGIMMIDFAIMRQEEGRSPSDAVHEASMERFRPIIMTTLAAFFGAVPLAIGLGADAESRIPLGLTICGGLLVSQLITLYVTPVTYLGFEWFQTRVLDRIGFFARGEKDSAKPATPASPPVAAPSA
jgi:HAE1 family hydrophobic/amphiphilic exporter-1